MCVSVSVNVFVFVCAGRLEVGDGNWDVGGVAVGRECGRGGGFDSQQVK
jgi:hypothetical protein